MVMVSPTLYCGLERAVTLEEGGEGRGGEGSGGGGEEKEQDSSGLL